MEENAEKLVNEVTAQLMENGGTINKSDYTGTTEISYEHIINYPAETNEADIETTLKDYLDERLANGTYVSEVTTERLITISPVFSIQATLYVKNLQ